jgi:hypothetical protein
MRRVVYIALAAAGAIGIAATTMGAADEVVANTSNTIVQKPAAAACEMQCSISSCEMPGRK